MNGTSSPDKEKREAIHYATKRGLSQRRACSLVAMHRSTARYEPCRPDDTLLVERIKDIQTTLPRFGVRRVHYRLGRTGEKVNHKRVQRVMRENDLTVKRTRRKKTIRTGASVPALALYPNHVWTIDFQEDALLGGRKVRILNILDEFTREWLAVVVGLSASAKTVMGALLPLFRGRGAPLFLRSDNGGEFVAADLKILLEASGTASRFIDPGHPWQNGFIESFHSRLRDEFLNRESFVSLSETRVRIEQHRLWYNRERPHSSLSYLSPDEFHQAWKNGALKEPLVSPVKTTQNNKT